MTVDRRSILAGLATVGLSPIGATAQVPYPTKPVRLVVPFAAGGPTDVVGRIYAERLSEILKYRVFVENKSGATGAIGCADVANSTPDGHHLLVSTSSTHLFNPLTQHDLPYKPLADFTNYAFLGITPMVVLVSGNSPFTTLDQLAKAITSNDKMTFGSSGTGANTHLTGELFKAAIGDKTLAHIPYRGSGPALQDLVSGHIDVVFETFGTALPFYKSGSLKILAVCGSTRSPVAPEIPTTVEQSLGDVQSYTFYMLSAPNKTPKETIATLEAANRAVMQDEKIRKFLDSIAFEPKDLFGSAEIDAFLKAEHEKWLPIVRRLNL